VWSKRFTTGPFEQNSSHTLAHSALELIS
jgi:hypothetical protein